MNYSEISILSIAGLLQLSVACYCWRLARMFGVGRVGWSLVSAFTLLAVVHLFDAVNQFQATREFGLHIEIIYSFVSFLLLAALAHLETVLKERQRLERQARKLATIGQLTEGVTHDFNNIVTAIQGHVSLLMLKRHDVETSESLYQINLAVNRAGALTRQLLAFGRGHSAQLELVDLNEVTENLAQMLRRLLGSHIKLENISAPNLPVVVGDVRLIEEMLVHLAINSRDAMSRGGQITLSAMAVTLDQTSAARHRAARPGDFVCVRVRDTGCGMPQEMINRFFEQYFAKEAGKGSGLGLSTVQRIAKQHSGWVEVQSRVGEGTEFSVFFPIAPRAVVDAVREPVAAHTVRKIATMMRLPQPA